MKRFLENAIAEPNCGCDDNYETLVSVNEFDTVPAIICDECGDVEHVPLIFSSTCNRDRTAEAACSPASSNL
jgi:hypothetical protein